jgi:hypothetical protein
MFDWKGFIKVWLTIVAIIILTIACMAAFAIALNFYPIVTLTVIAIIIVTWSAYLITMDEPGD